MYARVPLLWSLLVVVRPAVALAEETHAVEGEIALHAGAASAPANGANAGLRAGVAIFEHVYLGGIVRAYGTTAAACAGQVGYTFGRDALRVRPQLEIGAMLLQPHDDPRRSDRYFAPGALMMFAWGHAFVGAEAGALVRDGDVGVFGGVQLGARFWEW